MDDTTHDLDCGCSEYNALNRRQFLGTAGAGAAMFGATLFPDWLPKVVLAETYASDRDVIVSVFLRGGIDGLTMVVPFGDPAYYTSRPTIAIPQPDASSPARAIALDNFFGLPQGMAALLPAYAARDVLFVHACGQSTTTSRSHFDAQRYMEVGKAADPNLVTGWLGRHLASVPPMRTDAPLRALGLSQGLPKTLVGAPKTLPIANPANFALGGSSTTAAARLDLIKGDYATETEPMIKAAALDATNTVTLLQSLNINGYMPANGAVYANNGFARSLRSVAALIKADVGLEAAQVDIGGWDTHAAQDPIQGSMFNTMRTLAEGLAAFYADVMSDGSRRVTLIAMSEFGRNVRENGSLGTDHGRASAMLAMGKGIAGGRVLVDRWPGLARENLESGQDLRVTLDYKDILAEIVEKRLGNNNIGYVFPAHTRKNYGVTR